MPSDKKVIVIGAGPGGYVAAIRAAQLGAEVTVIEKGSLGGTCLNVGCIPTKALLSSVSVLRQIRTAGEFGINVGKVEPDFPGIVSRAKKIVEELSKGIGFLFKKNGVKLIRGRGEVIEPGKVRVTSESASAEEFEADAIIVAVGSVPAMPELFPFDGKTVITSNEALGLADVPDRLLVVGGGAIGVEFACIFSALGANVNLVEMMPQLLPGEDAEVAEELGKSLKCREIDVYTGVKLQEIGRGQDKGISARLSSGDELKADMVLVAVGRVPDTVNIGAERLNLLDEKGFIRVDEKMLTSAAGIYAVGDAVGGMLLAHKASEEGVAAAENAMGLDAKMDYGIIPRCIFTQPEIACVGVSEETARAEGKELKIGKFPFSSLGKARASGETEGMVKIISDAATDEILGIHIIGAGATDLIGEAALAMKLEATAEDIAGTIHPHPTFGEALKEASLAVDGKAIHI